jgi:drug/metabolite transporter (DMT)-like permease
LLSCRSVVGLTGIALWLRMGDKPAGFSPRDRWIARGLGLLFAATVFGLFEAIDLMDVPTAILAYFIYPLITGLLAALTGLERLGWRGGAAAIVAFIGLALMIGAHPGEIAFIGILFSFGAAVSRAAMLLITRAFLARADARLITWHSLSSSTVLFVAISLATQTWNPPHTALGWAALAGISLTTTVAILGVFISAGRVGPVTSSRQSRRSAAPSCSPPWWRSSSGVTDYSLLSSSAPPTRRRPRRAGSWMGSARRRMRPIAR